MYKMKKVISICFLIAVIYAQPHIFGCVQYLSSSTCQTCNEHGGYQQSPTQDGLKCICAKGFYEEQNGKCISCAQKFLSCKQCNKDSCISCIGTIALGFGQQPCINTSCENSPITTGCTSCSTQCNVCSTDRNFSSVTLPGGYCQCQKNYVKPTSNASYCLPCSHLIPGCMSCSSHQICLICDESLNFEPSPNTQNKCYCKPFETLFINTIPYYHTSECFDCSVQIQHCLTCASKTSCTVCEDGYGYNDIGQCKQCLDIGCLKCFRADNCTVCNSNNNFILNNNGHCKCSEGFALNSLNECQACNLSLIGCNSCSNSTICTSCDSSKLFTLKQTTNKCECASQFYYNNLSTICASCSTAMVGCLECSNDSICIKCDINNHFNISSNECYCQYGYYLALPTNSCALCRDFIPNCVQCKNQTFCTICDQGYAWKFFSGMNSKCSRCGSKIHGCLTCNNQDYCTSCNTTLHLLLFSRRCSCKAGYFMNQTTKQCQLCTVWSSQCYRCSGKSCTQCRKSYQVNGTGCSFKCTVPLCDECFNSTVCKTCMPFSSLVDDGGACRCDAGYYLKKNACVACQIPHCVSCRYGTTCTKCAKGFEMDLEDKCVASVVVMHNYQTRAFNILFIVAISVAAYDYKRRTLIIVYSNLNQNQQQKLLVKKYFFTSAVLFQQMQYERYFTLSVFQKQTIIMQVLLFGEQDYYQL